MRKIITLLSALVFSLVSNPSSSITDVIKSKQDEIDKLYSDFHSITDRVERSMEDEVSDKFYRDIKEFSKEVQACLLNKVDIKFSFSQEFENKEHPYYLEIYRIRYIIIRYTELSIELKGLIEKYEEEINNSLNRKRA